MARIAAERDLSTFSRLVQVAGLTPRLRATRPHTIFAPSNTAFAKLGPGWDRELRAQKPRLIEVVTRHLASGRHSAEALERAKQVQMIDGRMMRVSKRGGALYVRGTVRVTRADVVAANGVIHVVNAVMLPPEPPRAARPRTMRP